jgi:sialic acid synthase SpsE
MNKKIIYIVDCASNHDTSLNKAKQLIKEASLCKVDYVKFQIFTAKSLIDEQSFNQIGKLSNHFKWKNSVFKTYEKYELPLNWIEDLYNHCLENNIKFLATPYNLESVDILDKYQDCFKIGSGSINQFELLSKIASKNKPVWLSTGASTIDDIEKALEIFKNNKIVLFECNTNYEFKEDNLNYLDLNAFNEYKKYNCELGWSSHDKDDIALAIAISLGARFVERHFDLGDSNSPDSYFSLNPKEVKHMIDIGNKTLRILGNNKKIKDNELFSRCIQRCDSRTGLRPDMQWYDKYLKGLNK